MLRDLLPLIISLLISSFQLVGYSWAVNMEIHLAKKGSSKR
jgi:hypothetical protein